MARRPTIIVKITQDTRLVQTLAFNQDVVAVGREPGVDILLPSYEVSRSHCRLEYTEDRLHIRDLGSRNGTHVNGCNVSVHEIESGDNIQVGDFRLWIQLIACPTELEEKAAACCEIPTMARPTSPGDPSAG
jgi:pSer/pThr/pTyr-binding forkhead associated (FHA) protein